MSRGGEREGTLVDGPTITIYSAEASVDLGEQEPADSECSTAEITVQETREVTSQVLVADEITCKGDLWISGSDLPPVVWDFLE